MDGTIGWHSVLDGCESSLLGWAGWFAALGWDRHRMVGSPGSLLVFFCHATVPSPCYNKSSHDLAMVDELVTHGLEQMRERRSNYYVVELRLPIQVADSYGPSGRSFKAYGAMP